MSSGDGWTHCALGHRHWGLYGAAGLLVTDGVRVILQHRAPWTHEGDTWGIPGGARDRCESAVEAAIREAGEEADLSGQDVTPFASYADDHGGWSYTTVIARPVGELHPTAANAESVAVRWVEVTAVPALPLHTGFAKTWPLLAVLPRPCFLIVASHLAGSEVLSDVSRHGIAADRLPEAAGCGAMSRMIPQVHLADGARAADLAAEHGQYGTALVVRDEQELSTLH